MYLVAAVECRSRSGAADHTSCEAPNAYFPALPDNSSLLPGPSCSIRLRLNQPH